ncbi:3,4-dihydroxy-2-butanone-4-phosphate synthase [Vibrio cholerae]
MPISTPQEIIEDIRQGKMVILMDDEDRENEGDLIMAAEHITPAAINFMATHGRGLICLTLTKERCRRLGLNPMVQDNNAQYTTNFTVSIEAAEGVTRRYFSGGSRAHSTSGSGKRSESGRFGSAGAYFPVGCTRWRSINARWAHRSWV